MANVGKSLDFRFLFSTPMTRWFKFFTEQKIYHLLLSSVEYRARFNSEPTMWPSLSINFFVVKMDRWGARPAFERPQVRIKTVT